MDNMTEDQYEILCEAYGEPKVNGWLKQITDEIDRFSPTATDYREKNNPNSNPYELRYKDQWKDVIKEVTALSPFICITDYVQHIYDEVC